MKKINLIKTFIFLIIILTISPLNASIRTDNPYKTFLKWKEWVNQKNWNKVMQFFSLKYLHYIEVIYKNHNGKKEAMLKFLKENGVQNPDKFRFNGVKQIIEYILKNSERYQDYFKGINSQILKILVDYYDKSSEVFYKENLNYFKVLNYSNVRKLKVYLSNDKLFYLRWDLKGWYIEMVWI